jgi:predicted metal-dependent HD superfamily phosphohydrolase
MTQWFGLWRMIRGRTHREWQLVEMPGDSGRRQEGFVMEASTEVIKNAEAYVTTLFGERLPAWAAYHDFTHTLEVVEAVAEVGVASGLDAAQMSVVTLAAWFHDTGYMEGAEEHEERSVILAGEFLRAHGYPAERIAEVIGCIRATKVPQKPATLLEQVVCDSDILHIGQDDALLKSALLRQEMEARTGERFTDEAWLKKNIDFMACCTFHTPYAQRKYGERRLQNVEVLKSRLP